MTVHRRIQVGLGAWKAALWAIRTRPAVRVFVIVPLLVYGALLLGLLYLALSQWQPALLGWMAGSAAEGWLLGLFKFFSYLGSVVLWALLVVPAYALCNLLMSPVHSLAAENVLKSGGAKLPVVTGIMPWIRFFLRSLRIGLVKSALLILLSIPLFLGGFIPGIGLLFVYMSFVILSFDCTDYSLEVLGLSLAERFQYLRLYLWEYVGFTLVFFLSSFIPLAMIIVLPVGIVAGAHLILELSQVQATGINDER
jgi:uncharacterized protein involved in cysteine biosynthesis